MEDGENRKPLKNMADLKRKKCFFYISNPLRELVKSL